MWVSLKISNNGMNCDYANQSQLVVIKTLTPRFNIDSWHSLLVGW